MRPTFIKICKKGSVEEFSPMPYLATFVNCMLWVLYGMPIVNPNSTLVITINGAGCVIELVYLLLFVFYSNDKKKRLKVIVISILEVIAVGVLAALVLSLAHGTKRRSRIVGMLAIICNVMMYAAPLSVMKMVITTKSVEYMPFSISLASLANGIAWSIYAIRPFDPYIAAPNGLGTLFALAQLILYATYYNFTKKQKADKAKSEMGLAEVVVVHDNKVAKVMGLAEVVVVHDNKVAKVSSKGVAPDGQ